MAEAAPSAEAQRPKLCTALGCLQVLDNLTPYCQQRRLCTEHLKAACLLRKDGGNTLWRFCQQCGKLEPVTAFDGTKRSCRVQLAKRRDRAGAGNKKHKGSSGDLPPSTDAPAASQAAALAAAQDDTAWAAATPVSGGATLLQHDTGSEHHPHGQVTNYHHQQRAALHFALQQQQQQQQQGLLLLPVDPVEEQIAVLQQTQQLLMQQLETLQGMQAYQQQQLHYSYLQQQQQQQQQQQALTAAAEVPGMCAPAAGGGVAADPLLLQAGPPFGGVHPCASHVTPAGGSSPPSSMPDFLDAAATAAAAASAIPAAGIDSFAAAATSVALAVTAPSQVDTSTLSPFDAAMLTMHFGAGPDKTLLQLCSTSPTAAATTAVGSPDGSGQSAGRGSPVRIKRRSSVWVSQLESNAAREAAEAAPSQDSHAAAVPAAASGTPPAGCVPAALLAAGAGGSRWAALEPAAGASSRRRACAARSDVHSLAAPAPAAATLAEGPGFTGCFAARAAGGSAAQASEGGGAAGSSAGGVPATDSLLELLRMETAMLGLLDEEEDRLATDLAGAIVSMSSGLPVFAQQQQQQMTLMAVSQPVGVAAAAAAPANLSLPDSFQAPVLTSPFAAFACARGGFGSAAASAAPAAAAGMERSSVCGAAAAPRGDLAVFCPESSAELKDFVDAGRMDTCDTMAGLLEIALLEARALVPR